MLEPNEQKHVLNAITTALRTSGFKPHRIKVRESSGRDRPKHEIHGAHKAFRKEQLDVLFVISRPSYIWLITEAREGLCESHFAVHLLKDEYESFLESLEPNERLAWHAALTHAHTIWRVDAGRSGPRFRVRPSLLPYAHLYPDLTAKVAALACPQRLSNAHLKKLMKDRSEAEF